MARATLVALAIVAALATLAAGQSQCIYLDATRHNGPCSNSISCTNDRFCSTREGVCMPRLEVGADCSKERGGCVRGASCKSSPAGQMWICVADAGPGGDCNAGSFNTLPKCAGVLQCSGGVCTLGSIFDSCLRNEDCASNICQNNECKPKPKAASCVSNIVGMAQQCELDSTCGSLTNTCVARGSTGSFCVDSSDCQVSHSCLPTDSLSPNGTCVKWFSLKAGERCDDGVQCAESLRCYRNRCASKRAVFCTNDNQCSVDERCHCGNSERLSGVGTCVPWKCAKSMEAWVLCMDENCGGDVTLTPHNHRYEGSCAQRFCKKEWEASVECSSATSLFASVLAAFGIALFVSKAVSA